MALTEQRVVKSITVSAETRSISVQWADQVLRDGVIVSETFHRKAYGAEQRAEFEAEVEGAAAYVDLITWGPVDPTPRIPQVVTRRQARLALLQSGLLDDVEAAIAASDNRSVQIEWADATEFRRDWPALLAMQPVLGLTDAQLDDLFTLAASL